MQGPGSEMVGGVTGNYEQPEYQLPLVENLGCRVWGFNVNILVAQFKFPSPRTVNLCITIGLYMCVYIYRKRLKVAHPATKT